MIILVSLIFLMVVCVFWNANTKMYDDTLSILCIIIVGVLLLICSISIPVERCGFNSNIKKLQAFEMTLDNMRQKESIENAAIQMEVAKWNQWIAGKKYWNDTLFDIWIPDEIKTIEFIK
jgi:hypothetical protein